MPSIYQDTYINTNGVNENTVNEAAALIETEEITHGRGDRQLGDYLGFSASLDQDINTIEMIGSNMQNPSSDKATCTASDKACAQNSQVNLKY